MAKRKYSLERGQPSRLEISSGLFGWKNVSIKLDGFEIGQIPGKKELLEGREFQLDANHKLKVQLVRGFNSEDIHVLVNGQPVPGSSSDPHSRLAAAYGVIFFVAGLSFVVGLIAELLRVELLLEMGLGIFAIVSGLIYGALGLLVWKKHSRVALGIAVALFIIDGLLSLVGGSVSAVFMRIFLLIPMFGGFGAIKEIKERSKTASSTYSISS